MRAPFAVKALIPAYAAAAAVFALWAAPAQAATHAECARRLAEIRSSNPDVGRAIPGGSGNESLVLRFCLNDIPSEGLDCVF